MDAFLASFTSDSRLRVQSYDLSLPTVFARVSLDSFRVDLNNILIRVFGTWPQLPDLCTGSYTDNLGAIHDGCAAVAELATIMLWKRLKTVAEQELGPEASVLYPNRPWLSSNFELPSGVVAIINSFGRLNVADNLPPTRVVHIHNSQNINNFGLATAMTDAQFQKGCSFLGVLNLLECHLQKLIPTFPNSEEAPSNQTLEPVSLKWGRVDDKTVIDYLSNTPLVGHAGDTSVPAGPIPVSDLAVVGARYMIHPRGVFDHPKGRSCYLLGRGTQSDRQYTASAARGIHDYEISKFCQILMREGVSVNTDRSVRPKRNLATQTRTGEVQDCSINLAEVG